jgi:hypothetical protein
MYRFLTNLPGVLEIDVVATESVNTLGGWEQASSGKGYN